MAEPMTPAAFAAAASGITLAVFGVDYYSLLYGMVGAFIALGQAGQMGRSRAVVYVVLATLVGSAIGNAAVAFFGVSNRAFLILGCVVGGAGSQLLLSALVRAALARIDGIGGKT